jgi:hypothetical protein
MSTPISAIIASAVRADTPGIEHKMVNAASKGQTRPAMSALSPAIERSRKSMCSITFLQVSNIFFRSMRGGFNR